VRWQHPHQGLLSPAAFIAQAERSDVIEVVTDWVIVAAIGQLGRWHHAGWPVAVSVNVSAATLGRDDLVGRIAETLSTQSVPAQQLTIEITETAIMSNPTTAQRCLRDLRDLGCRISIDDFGTGNTSLALLTQLPVDELKIDRMFISSLTHSTVHRAIAQGVAAMAHQMNLTTVAEGIEDAVTAQSVAALDIDLMQGYHFARPQPPEFWNSHFIPQRPHATGSEFVIATS
jgi:EAL domain-containing protein (putative c-di-GMP-specific phosphodiesterase class I)